MTGTCRICHRVRSVDLKGRVDEHPNGGTIEVEGARHEIMCDGGGKTSAEQHLKNRTERNAALARKVDRNRADAAVAMDAVLVGNDAFDREEIERLIKLALVDYRLKMPKSRATNLWFFFDGKHDQKRRVRLRDRVDVYCTFCRCLLVSRAQHGYDYSTQVRHHTKPCALAHLAGLRTPAPPGTVRLPEEFIQDEA